MYKVFLNTFISVIFLVLSNFLMAEQNVLILEGVYQGKDLYVKNPNKTNEVGKSISKIIVNGKVTSDEVNSSSLVIDLSLYQLVVGDTVEVKIYHDKEVRPVIKNPEVLKPKSTFVLEDIYIENKVLSWETTQENGQLTYIIEQYKWNEWVKTGEVDGNGMSTKNTYKFKVSTHSGENKFRVYQVDFTGKKRTSKEVILKSNKEEVTFYPKKVREKLTFSAETSFEIVNHYGNLVKKGKDKEIDLSALKTGVYYIKFDNEISSFTKQ